MDGKLHEVNIVEIKKVKYNDGGQGKERSSENENALDIFSRPPSVVQTLRNDSADEDMVIVIAEENVHTIFNLPKTSSGMDNIRGVHLPEDNMMLIDFDSESEEVIANNITRRLEEKEVPPLHLKKEVELIVSNYFELEES